MNDKPEFETASQNFFAAAKKQFQSVFCRGVYLTKYTSQAAECGIWDIYGTNYARSRLQSLYFQMTAPQSFESL